MTDTQARVFSPSATYYECGICDQLHALEWDGDCRQDSARLNPEDCDEHHGTHDWQYVDMDQVDEVRALHARPQGEPPKPALRWTAGQVRAALGKIEHLLSRHCESNEVDMGLDDEALALTRATLAAL